MNIILFISGIADSKWPPPTLQLDPQAAGAVAASPPKKLSPFDESALECALKIRDADAQTRISVFVVGAPVQESLLRAIASFRLDHVAGLTVVESELWDARNLARRFGDVLARQTETTDLVLIGREFGDFDDGLLPPYLAEVLRLPFVGLVQEVRCDAGGWIFFRERGDIEERIRVRPAALASITNDKRNRLRFPLMKNIAAAKKAAFVVENTGPGSEARVRLLSSSVLKIARQQDGCRMLAGSIEAQAEELSAFLLSRVKA